MAFNKLRIGGNLVDFDSPDEAEFVQFTIQTGTSASLDIPVESSFVRNAVTGYRVYLSELAKQMEELASSRTQDRKLKQRIIEALRQKLGLRSLEADKTARLI